jgi:hypothetical protein
MANLHCEIERKIDKSLVIVVFITKVDSGK